MKKILLIFIIIFVCSCCIYSLFFVFNQQDNYNIINHNNNTAVNEPEEVWEDNNPIVVGMYKENKTINKMILTNEYTSPWKFHSDIVVFDILYTNEDQINIRRLADVFDSFLDNYSNIEDYKIGYLISFNVNNELITKQILRPADTEGIFEYLEVYLYDAIYHRHDKWYSHTTEKEYNDSTILGVIKLTSGVKINDITSDITVTAFTYDSDDFDEYGMYKGVSKYTAVLKKS